MVPTILTLSLTDPAIAEGNQAIATVTRSGDVAEPLTAWLEATGDSEITIPASVEIPAGQTSVDFPVVAVDDADLDGVQSVSLYAWESSPADRAFTSLIVLDNDTPISVVPDSYETGEDATLTVSGFGVLANDFSANIDLTAAAISGPSHGTLALDSGGGFTYTPDANYFGTDSFTYRASDLAGLSGTATVSLTVWGMDDRIQLHVPGPQTTAEDAPLSFSAAGGNAITITDIESPRVLVTLLATPGILTLPSTEGLEFPYPENTNNSNGITFYADSPAEAIAALDGLIFTPGADQTTPTSISVLIQDMTAVSMPIEEFAVIPISFTPVNDAPAATADTGYELMEDTSLTITAPGVLTNDTDIDGDPLSAILVSAPANGTVSLRPDGGFTYTPSANFFGLDSFTYRAVEPSGLWSEATVTVRVWETDDPLQISAPGSQTIAEDATLTFSAANGNAITFVDPESPRIVVGLMTSDGMLTLANTKGLEFPYPEYTNNSSNIIFYADDPAEANAALEGLIFTPSPGLTGMAGVGVHTQDLTVLFPQVEDFVTIPVELTPVNDAPVANPDGVYELNEDKSLTVTSPGVLTNDTDLDGDSLSAVLVIGATNGTVTLEPGGGFTYTPSANFFGTDSFTYRAVDSSGLWSEATVMLKVWGVDDLIQVSVPGPQTTPEETPITFSAANGNAITIIDPESPRVYVELSAADGLWSIPSTDGLEFPYSQYMNNAQNIMFFADSPAEANAALDGLIFTPNPNATFETDIYIYARDESFPSPPYIYYAFVSFPLSVTPVDDAPVAVEDGPYTIEAGELLTVNHGGWPGYGVLDNDHEVDGQPITAVLVSGPSHGTLTLNANGSFTYTADTDFSGTDSFTYRASDGQLLSDPATVTINVTPQNLPPIGAADAYTVEEDGTLTVTAPGFLGNDLDPEGQPLSASLVVGQGHGTLVFNSDGSFTYTPASNYHGADEFWYRPFDGVNYGEPVRVVLAVNSVNDIPTATGEAYTLDEDTTLSVPAAGVLANDSDGDGEGLTAVLVSGPVHGTLTLNPDGSFTYTPEPDYYGVDGFTYRATDASGAWSEAIVSLTVQPVSEPPVALDDSYSTAEDTPVSAVVSGFTSVTMVSDPGDYVGQGQTYNFTTATGTFTISRNYDNGVTLRYQDATHWWYWNFAAADEGLLVPGLYESAMRFPFQDPGTPAMDVYGDGRGSNTLTGWFRIDDIAYGPGGEVLVFEARFEQHCSGVAPALHGEIRYNAGGTAPGGVLANDSDIDGDPLTAILVEGPANGQVFLNPNGTFTYVPNANFTGTDEFRYKVSDGALQSNIATATITVSPVNDAPVNIVPGTQTLVEDTTLVFSSANGNAIWLTDVDAGNSVVELQLSVNGFLTFPTTAGLTFVTGSNGGNIIVVRGTLADLNAALEGLSFRPGSNFTGSYNLQVRTSDLGNTGAGNVLTDLDYIDLSITPVNDAPQNVVPLVTPATPEDTPLTFSPYIWVTDVDQTTGASSAAVRVAVEIVAGGGTLTVIPSSGVIVTGNGTASLVLDDRITDINTVLRTLTFTPAADANSSTAPVLIRVTTDDLANGGPGALTDTDTFAINVTPVNDAPLLILSGTSAAVAMNSGAYSIPDFASSIAGPATATDEQTQTLAYEVQVTGTTGSLAFATVPSIAMDGTLGFTPAAGTWGTATIRVVARDSGGTTNGGVDASAEQTFTITATDAAPTSTGLAAVAVDEDSAPTAVSLAGSFADLEDGAAGLAYAVVGNTNAGLFNSVSITSGVLTLGYAANASGSATLTVRATDSGGLFVDVPLAVTVAPVNDAPTFTAGSNVTVASNAGPQSIAGWATAISAGAADEAGQALSFEVSTDSPLLFAVQPAINPITGTLAFTPVAGASGTAIVTVVLRDSGSAANASVPQTFTITLTPPAWPQGIEVVGSEVVISGTIAADTITINPLKPKDNGTNGVKVTVTLGGQTFSQTIRQSLTGIRVSTGDGNDTITIADSIVLAAIVDAGAGDDSISSGSGNDLLFGGTGNDTINAGAGNDDVDSGSGNDAVAGGLGDDLILAGAGDDIVQGGDGNDFLIGGTGEDQLHGENGHDILVAGMANVRNPASDSLRQVLGDWDPTLGGIYVDLRERLAVSDDSASAEVLEGGTGIDWFWSENANDTLDLVSGEHRN